MYVYISNVHLFISAWRISSVSCKAGLAVKKSFSFVCLGKSSSSLHLQRTALLGKAFLVGSFFFQHLEWYYSTVSWPAKFLLRNLLVALQELPCMKKGFCLLMLWKLSLILDLLHCVLKNITLGWNSGMKCISFKTRRCKSPLRFGKFSCIISLKRFLPFLLGLQLCIYYFS